MQNENGSVPWGDKEIHSNHRESIDMTSFLVIYMYKEPDMEDSVKSAIKFLEQNHNEGKSFQNEFINNSPDIKTASQVGYAIAKAVSPDHSIVNDAISFVENHMKDGEPIVAGEFKMQNKFTSTLSALSLLGTAKKTETKLFHHLFEYVKGFQQDDGSFYYPLKDAPLKYKWGYMKANDYRSELTSYFVTTFADDLNYTKDTEPVKSAFDYLTTKGMKLKFKLPHVRLSIAKSLLAADTSLTYESLPENFREEIRRVIFSDVPDHIQNRMHTAGNLIYIRDKLKKV